MAKKIRLSEQIGYSQTALAHELGCSRDAVVKADGGRVGPIRTAMIVLAACRKHAPARSFDMVITSLRFQKALETIKAD